tara:strand:+ start:27 stop:287 length:261 start_codon:yes stop_codon:yes gene_type:complete
MFGFTTFAGSPFASVADGAIVSEGANMIGEAIVKANANAIWNGDVVLLGEADVTVMGTITGSGWVRQNPDTPEWDVTQSSDWNRIN